MAKPGFWTSSRVGQLVSQALLGLVLIFGGILLINYAMDSMSMGQPITRAWVAGVAGLMLLVPGLVVAALAVINVFTESKKNGDGPNGPAPLKFV